MEAYLSLEKEICIDRLHYHADNRNIIFYKQFVCYL